MAFHERKNALLDPDDFERVPRIRNMPAGRKKKSRDPIQQRVARQAKEEQVAELHEQGDGADSLAFTYQPARHERQWLLDSLGGFVEQQWFDDVLRQVKGGKEATVYQCLANASFPAAFIAAKVYRPRRFRNLKNDHAYREGREPLDADGRKINDDGMLHAIRKKTQYGMELMHTSWLAHEYNCLTTLHTAGVDVPQPYASSENAILMEYIGDKDLPAPPLSSLDLPRAEAQHLFERMLENIRKMLANHLVHGDLSAYNILYHAGQITIIDFPQAIDPEVNRNAYTIFVRDITRVCEYFIPRGVRANPRQIAAHLWRDYNYPFSPDVHPRLLDDQNDDDLRYWRKLQGNR